MKKLYLKEDGLTDEGLRLIACLARRKLTKDDDSFNILIAGSTGSGKTTLSLHFLRELLEKEPEIRFVALSRERFAQCLGLAKQHKGLRYVAYDEADVISTEAMTQWNRDIVKLYAKIRGQNMCHIWCHPNLNGIQKAHVEEVVNVLLYIPSKKKPRPYYVILKKDLLRFMEKYKTLKKQIFLKHIREYAFYKGWFRAYPEDTGLWKEYLALKQDAMDESIDDFVSKYAKGDTMSLQRASDTLNVSINFLRGRVALFIKNGVLDANVKSASGRYFLSKSDIDKIRQELLSKEGNI